MNQHSIVLEGAYGLCGQDPFIFATVYIFVVLGSFPLAMITTANYEIKTYSWKMFLHLAQTFLMCLALGVVTHFGLFGILAYSVSDLLGLCNWNKPIFKMPYAKYIGSLTFHHVLTFLALFLAPFLVDCMSFYYYSMIQMGRCCTRYLLILSYLCNKQHWKSPRISLVILVLIAIIEVVYISMIWWTSNYLIAIASLIFVLLDIEFTIAVYSLMKKFSLSNGENENDLEAPDKDRSSITLGSSCSLEQSTNFTAS